MRKIIIRGLIKKTGTTYKLRTTSKTDGNITMETKKRRYRTLKAALKNGNRKQQIKEMNKTGNIYYRFCA